MKSMAFVLLGVLAALALVVAALVRGPSPEAGEASSHREAPLISEDPTADTTDLYAFVAQNDPDELNIVANWIPAEDPAAGPMWYEFSSSARYNIYIDRNGDARPDVTYRFRFQDSDPVAFLRNNVQRYTVTRIRNGNSQVVARGATPPNNVGPRFLGTFFGTTMYNDIAADTVRPLRGGGQVFAGQREDAFFGDIGAIFDAVGFRKNLGNEGGGKDFFAGYAVHTIALHVPLEQLDTRRHVIGIWASTDRRVESTNGGRSRWVQVSRLGNPLVNELLIPTELKDRWNRQSPANDEQFVRFYRRPILAALINQLYPGAVNAPETGRADLVAALLTGVPGLNRTGNRLADMLRINLSTAPTAPVGDGNRLGVLANDLAGFPNGRRLEDDVIDIAERVVAGVLVGNNVALGDGVNANNRPFLSSFPYVGSPFSGFANTKGNCDGVREEVGDGADATC
jgi:hypothetical protein